jgi:drug/metabolite transporter (DMT)-like permease
VNSRLPIENRFSMTQPLLSDAPPKPWSRVLLWVALLSMETLTQLAFKAGSEKLDGGQFDWLWVTTALTTLPVWFAIIGYLATFVVWMLILQRTDLSKAFPMTGLSYITVPLLAWVAFGEVTNGTRALGIAFITAGVMLLGRET